MNVYRICIYEVFPEREGNMPVEGKDEQTQEEKKRKVILNTDFRSMKKRLKGMGKVPINNKVGSPIKVKYNYFVIK